MAIYTYNDVELHHLGHAGGGLHGTAAGDTFNLTATNTRAQFHPWGGWGNDTINMIFSDIDGFAHGHHTYADLSGNVNFSDTYDFIDIHEVHSGGVVVGRLNDYDSTRDILKIEGQVVDLYDLESFEHPSVSSIRIVEYNGAHTDPDAHAQQWLLIETSTGGTIFYAIEGARVAMDGNGGSQTQETHFLLPEDLPDNFSDLETVEFVAKHNYVPLGYTAEAGGVVYNDRDRDIADVEDAIGDEANEASQFGDLIAAGLNDDLVTALGGDDFVWGGSGHDKILGGWGDDYIEGNSGSDILKGGNGADHLIGGTGDDRLVGGNGGDTLIGGSGADIMSGGLGYDTADYSASVSGVQINLSKCSLKGWSIGKGGQAEGDKLKGVEAIIGSGTSDDRIKGSAKDNKFYGLGGDDKLFGYSGDDHLEGGEGRDRLHGGAGNDSLYGGSGDDILIGGRGSGSDVLSGGLGDDVFIFHRGFGTDTISDFDVFDSTDIIDVSRISDFDGFEDLMENHVTQVGADTLIEDGNGNSILLENVNSADLSADDFLFS
ncbi:calcium-binding protein [Aliiroseovarius marinus]|uniref:calcium-binding protein n=1 Tax=Aliiroseovarius marinus TaxID=2500159 RepID=UPI0024946538|nr:calcium-binding protein [Aliiroseovarius marinus]